MHLYRLTSSPVGCYCYQIHPCIAPQFNRKYYEYMYACVCIYTFVPAWVYASIHPLTHTNHLIQKYCINSNCMLSLSSLCVHVYRIFTTSFHKFCWYAMCTYISTTTAYTRLYIHVHWESFSASSPHQLIIISLNYIERKVKF